ncbi:MAG: hypothetical protein IT369_10370, partial [Candidatus Latescibacteria bacterium]|nr:hypothetical protein [Candidatus Latescibacterota bacterium]
LMGQWCAREGLPTLHLVEPLPEVGSDPGGPWTPVRLQALRRGMSRDHLQVAPADNPRRGAGPCVPISRALVRYPDLLMQQQVLHWQSQRAVRYPAVDLERRLAEYAWPCEVAERVVRGARYWGLKYLEDRVGQEVEAVILERPAAGYVIEVEGCQVRSFLPGGRERRGEPGDRLRVQIVQVSARRDHLLLRRTG